ncbi:MAG: PEP-CTERM sorting domain-containing protein [Burkholderiaceae bacterium]|nr:PEP-CTERM sorting domain-containing protein [Burkholderiaceae bacterium]
MFIGSANGLAAGWQSVDLSDQAAAIDAGQIGFKLDAYLGGVGDQEDNPLLYVSFLDAAGAELGHTELGPIFLDLRANLTVLGGFHTSGWLPGGTRSIQFSLSMDAPDGDSTGAYADNLSFTLTAAVPEPQTWALMALGLLAVGAGARRRAR